MGADVQLDGDGRRGPGDAGVPHLPRADLGNGDVWVPTLRHIAREGRVDVIGVTCCIRRAAVPRSLPRAEEIYGGEDGWMVRGNTTICGPDGEILGRTRHGDVG
jgi:hypothetical protein